MNQKREHKRFQKSIKKSKALLVSLILLLSVSVGGTVAYLIHTAGPLDNVFTLSKITTDIEEELNGDVKSNVKVKNTGNTEAYIRAAVVVTWKDQKGNVYGQMPKACTDPNCQHSSCGADYVIHYDLVTSGEGWIKSSDGFYYWTKPVLSQEEDTTADKSQCKTGVLISTCKPLNAAPETGYYLNVEIIGSGIQSKPTSVVTTNWSSGVTGVANDETTLEIKTQTSTSGN